MAKTENADQLRLLTSEGRVSYPHLFKPNAVKAGDKPKYSLTLLMPKDTDLKPLKKVIRLAKEAKWGVDKTKWPKNLMGPVNDGDDPQYADKEGYPGHWIVKASTNEDQKPGVVDQNVEPILDQSKFYPGCYARAYVYAYAWEYMGKNGVSFILDHVQKTRDGKSFAGKKAAGDVFQPVAAPAGAAGNDEDEDDEE